MALETGDEIEEDEVAKLCRMGRLSVETRSKVIVMRRNRYPVSVIQEKLLQEGVVVSKVLLFALIKMTSLVIDLPRKHRSSKLCKIERTAV